MKILVTGSAGFIGYHVARRLLDRGDEVLGIDNLNDYYDPGLKHARLAECGVSVPGDVAGGSTAEGAQPAKGRDGPAAGGGAGPAAGARMNTQPRSTSAGSVLPDPYESATYPNYRFMHIDIADRPAMEELFRAEQFDVICHLAAQAGVRYSLENPHAYIQANLVGFANILEGARRQFRGGSGSVAAAAQSLAGSAAGAAQRASGTGNRSAEDAADAGNPANTAEAEAGAGLKHLVYASSSSVYGMNGKMPFSTSDNVDHPVSLYAATKKSNELTAHTYAYLYGIPTTGLRFFTVYGPWGRPDMAPMLFTKAILSGEPIKVFNYGEMKRDFSYIDDIVEGVVRTIDRPAQPDPHWSAQSPNPAGSTAPYRLYNIGNGAPVGLMDFIRTLEEALGHTADKEMHPIQPGDVSATWADTVDLERDTGFKPDTPLAQGIAEFVRWYRGFYGV